ncbi:MAG: hypothetical protein JWR80_9504 [Bradyrhizobium sp.]|nr:hypothetical protein [Bradyrhizobium sp.]
MKKLVSDLFKGVSNQQWELARFMSAWAVLSYSAAFIYALTWRGSVPDWASLGTGYGAVLLGAGALIGIKDFAKAKSEAVTSAAVTASDAGVVP